MLIMMIIIMMISSYEHHDDDDDSLRVTIVHSVTVPFIFRMYL